MTSLNGVLKRRLEQALLIRGSRDFESVKAWQDFIDEVVRKANKARGRRVAAVPGPEARRDPLPRR